MTSIIFRVDAHKRQQQQEKQEELELSDENASKTNVSTVTDLNQNQRQALKFGFSRVASSKVGQKTHLQNSTSSFLYI